MFQRFSKKKTKLKKTRNINQSTKFNNSLSIKVLGVVDVKSHLSSELDTNVLFVKTLIIVRLVRKRACTLILCLRSERTASAQK